MYGYGCSPQYSLCYSAQPKMSFEQNVHVEIKLRGGNARIYNQYRL